eukprot:1910620-Rhodomonas_salina.6
MSLPPAFFPFLFSVRPTPLLPISICPSHLALMAGVENKGYLRSTSYSSEDLGTFLRVKGLSYLIMMYHTLAYRAFSI